MTFGDITGPNQGTIRRQNAFLINAGDVLEQLKDGKQGARSTTCGTVISCIVDVASGLLKFRVCDK